MRSSERAEEIAGYSHVYSLYYLQLESKRRRKTRRIIARTGSYTRYKTPWHQELATLAEMRTAHAQCRVNMVRRTSTCCSTCGSKQRLYFSYTEKKKTLENSKYTLTVTVAGDNLDRVNSNDFLQFFKFNIFQDECPHVVAETIRTQLALKF